MASTLLTLLLDALDEEDYSPAINVLAESAQTIIEAAEGNLRVLVEGGAA